MHSIRTSMAVLPVLTRAVARAAAMVTDLQRDVFVVDGTACARPAPPAGRATSGAGDPIR